MRDSLLKKPGFFGSSLNSKKDKYSREFLKILVNRCMGCNKSDRDCTLHIHRMVPGRHSGRYTLDNVRVLCVSCHKREEREGKIFISVVDLLQMHPELANTLYTLTARSSKVLNKNHRTKNKVSFQVSSVIIEFDARVKALTSK